MKQIRFFLQNVSFADKCLLIIFVVCLLQTVFTLFFDESNTVLTNGIDVVIRTTLASIFGYILSVNFQIQTPDYLNIKKHNSGSATAKENIESTSTKASIGFQTSAKDFETLEIGGIENTEIQSTEYSKQAQTIIATIIGISTLCILLLVRNFLQITPDMVSAISQLRDFISGSVGFLLGTQIHK